MCVRRPTTFLFNRKEERGDLETVEGKKSTNVKYISSPCPKTFLRGN